MPNLRHSTETTLANTYVAVYKYLGEQYLRLLSVSDIDDKLPEHAIIYRRNNLDNCWVIHVPKFPHEPLHIGQGRIICISKDAGKILYDGSDGLG